MTDASSATLIQLRRGTYQEWTETNPFLEEGEAAYAYDVEMLKIGDGVHNYNDLNPVYANGKLDVIVLDKEEWTGDTAPYVQRVDVDFMYDFFNPNVGLNPSSSYNVALVEVQEYSKLYKGVSGNGYVDFYATEKPLCSLSLTLKRL